MTSRVAVTGSSGLIGSALVRSLRAAGVTVVRLVRHEPRAADEARWDPSGRRREQNAAALAGCTALVHLAGAGVGDKRWTTRYKQEIRDSRVLVHDLPRLRQLAMHHGGYLDQTERPPG